MDLAGLEGRFPMHDDSRLKPPFWKHDAYTLNLLRDALTTGCRRVARPSGTVVDYGSGTAPYREVVSPLFSDYVACDIVAGDGVDVVLASDQRLPFEDATVDCVLSVQVLEHVWDVDGYLRECGRVLKPGGRLVLSTHGTWLYHPHPTDYRRWTRDGLIRELTERGFIPESVQALVGPLAWTTQFRAIGYHTALSRFGVPGKWVSAAICGFMHLRMKLEDWLTPSSIRESNSAVYVIVATGPQAGA